MLSVSMVYPRACGVSTGCLPGVYRVGKGSEVNRNEGFTPYCGTS